SGGSHPLDEADHVALGIGEEGDGRSTGDVHRPHHRFTSQLFSLVEVGLGIVDLDIKRDMTGSVGRRADAPGDGAVATRVNHAVVHRVVRIDLPIEQLAEELLEPLAVLADDLEVDDRITHVPRPPGGLVCKRLSHTTCTTPSYWASATGSVRGTRPGGRTPAPSAPPRRRRRRGRRCRCAAPAAAATRQPRCTPRRARDRDARAVGGPLGAGLYRS